MLIKRIGANPKLLDHVLQRQFGKLRKISGERKVMGKFRAEVITHMTHNGNLWVKK